MSPPTRITTSSKPANSDHSYHHPSLNSPSKQSHTPPSPTTHDDPILQPPSLSSHILPRRRPPRIRRPQLIPTRRERHKRQTSTHIPPRHVAIPDPLDIRKHLPRRRPVFRRAGQEAAGPQAREAEDPERVVRAGREGEPGRGAVVGEGLTFGVGEGEG